MIADRAALFARLDALGIQTATFEHAPVFTVEEARALRGRIAGAHAKNLFVKDRKDALFLVVAIEDGLVDLKGLHRLIGASGRLSFGKPELLMETLGVPPGSVTPFAAINDRPPTVEVILDAALMAHRLLNFHPLENGATTSIDRDDLLRFLDWSGHTPRILPVSADAAAGGGVGAG